MKKLHSVLFAAATVAAMGATPAFATPANGGIIAPDTPSTGTVMTATMSSSFTAAGAFDDMFLLFTPPPDATDVHFAITAGTGVTFTSFNIAYFGGGGDPIWTTGTVTPTGIDIDIPGGLISGAYQVDVQGAALAGSSYSGTVTLETAVAAVPEPSSYGLLAAGLAVVGLLARRRATHTA